MKKHTLVLTFLLLTIAYVSNAQNHSVVPDWVQSQWKFVTKGIWVAPNPFESEKHPFDSYEMSFQIEAGGTVLTGKLSAMKDGKEMKRLWTFMDYWHPGDQKLIKVQYGDNPSLGNIAIGEEFETVNQHQSKSVAVSYKSDGSSFKVGHKSDHEDDQIISRSFNIIGSEWQPRGEFVWKLKKDQ